MTLKGVAGRIWPPVATTAATFLPRYSPAGNLLKGYPVFFNGGPSTPPLPPALPLPLKLFLPI